MKCCGAYLFAIVTLVASTSVVASPDSCVFKSDSDGKNGAYYCGGIQVTQSSNTFFEPSSRISEFKVKNAIAFWRYTVTSGGGVHPINSKTAYYSNRWDYKVGWRGIEDVTQSADSFGGFNEEIVEFKILDSDRVTWRFLKSSNSDSKST